MILLKFCKNGFFPHKRPPDSPIIPILIYIKSGAYKWSKSALGTMVSKAEIGLTHQELCARVYGIRNEL